MDSLTTGSQQDEVHNRGGVGKLKIIYDEVFLKHRPPPGHPHPECPARVSTARSELDRLEVSILGPPDTASGVVFRNTDLELSVDGMSKGIEGEGCRTCEFGSSVPT